MLHKKSVLLHSFYCRPGTTKHLQDIEQAAGTHPSGCIQHAYPLSCFKEMVVSGLLGDKQQIQYHKYFCLYRYRNNTFKELIRLLVANLYLFSELWAQFRRKKTNGLCFLVLIHYHWLDRFYCSPNNLLKNSFLLLPQKSISTSFQLIGYTCFVNFTSCSKRVKLLVIMALFSARFMRKAG